MESLPAMEPMPLEFETDDGFGARARIGLILLESDQTLEIEARAVAPDGVAWYHSRIPNADEVTPETLTAMEARLPEAARLLPTAFGFDTIAYGCTSASTLIGSDRVAAAIRTAHPGIACTDPIRATATALHALGARRVAIITPYTAEVTAPIATRLSESGLEVTALASFLEGRDSVVARISPASIAAAVRRVTSAHRPDAVFVSCTSLRVLEVIPELEAELDLPVVSSNTALLWHALRLAGVEDHIPVGGRLFRLGVVPDANAAPDADSGLDRGD